MLDNIKISKKLPMFMVGLAIANVALTVALGIWLSYRDVLLAAEKSNLVITEAKKDELEKYLDSISQDLRLHADNGFTVNAVRELSQSWAQIPGNKTEYLHRAYLNNVTTPQERVNTIKGRDGSLYSEVHAQYHPYFKSLLEKRGYYDVFLFDRRGNLIYSVLKELDYATNMYSGPWKNTDLANAFKAAIDGSKDQMHFFDFKPYEPSYGAPASFTSTPIFDNGQKIGVLAFQMPVDEINKRMTLIEGEAEGTMHYLIGRDGLLRNNPHSDSANNDVILKEAINAQQVQEAYAKYDSGAAKIATFGVDGDSLYAYDIIDFMGTQWVIKIDVPKITVIRSLINSQSFVIAANLVILFVIAIISIYVARQLSKPLSRQADVMKPLANGDFTAEVPDQKRGDEIGDIARAVQQFKENGLRMKEMEADAEMQKAEAERQKKESQKKLADDFDARVGSVIRTLSESADSMSSTAQQMKTASEQTSELSSTVASAATEADSNVQTVAAASEELSASSAEIARQIDSVAKKSSEAARDAQETSESVNELNVLADSIGEVVGTIKDIAEQTNLLALNATIEAARAGEAGKGFAVVADEVKKLANETGTKTEEIGERVNRIQEAIRNSVTAMDKIIANVSEIDHATTTVATAVEEQNAATAEIGRNVAEASTGTQQVSQSIIQVQQNAAESGEAANIVLNSSVELKKQSDILKSEVNAFLSDIRGDNATLKEQNNTEDTPDDEQQVA
jgi:methyl-accepting chemotaxis protein